MKLIICFALILTCCSAISQEINFDDLRRAGRQLVKTYPVPGTAAEGQRYFQQFAQTDGERLEQSKQQMAEWNATHPPCRSGDVCWQTEGMKDRNTYKIRCLKGVQTGNTTTVCFNDRGMWDYNCGFLRSYYQSSFEEAVKKACDI